MCLTTFGPEDFAQRLMAERVLVLSLPENVAKSVQAIFDPAFSFFRQSVSAKRKCTFTQDMGYRQLGDEYSKSPVQADQSESFSVSARVPLPPSQLKSAGAELLYQRMLVAFDLLEAATETLVVRLADHFTNRSNRRSLQGALRRWSRLQVNYSLPSDVQLQFINEEHEDLDLLTLTMAPTPGLEVEWTEKMFFPTTTAPDQVLILPGEIAYLLSGGQLQPVYHRVRAYPQIPERVSLLFFADLEPRHCEPWVANDINAEVDIGKRVMTNVHRFGLAGFDSDLG
jgi:isopenicillin N synthase-like dioxygenase